MRGPSNPSPFSAELQTFIVTKYDPLLSIVEELSDKLDQEQREKLFLEERVNRLEASLQNTMDRVRVSDGAVVPSAGGRDVSKTGYPADETENRKVLLAALKPWLFSAKLDTSVSAIQYLLDFQPSNTVVMDCRDLRRENDLWLMLLEKLPPSIFAVDNESHAIDLSVGGQRLYDLRESARKALLQICKNELLVVIKNVPNKSTTEAVAASGYTTSGVKKAQVTLIAVLIASMAEAWDRVGDVERVELGRVAIVLLGDQVGHKLRAGQAVFEIEPLN